MAPFTPPLAWSLQWPELMMILFIALLIFGKRLPDVARSLGRGVSEFKAGLRDTVEEFEEPTTTPPPRRVKPLPPAQEPVAREEKATAAKKGEEDHVEV